MAIKVGHSVAAGPVAGAAFGGGQGQARAALSAGLAGAVERESVRKQEIAAAERERLFQTQRQDHAFALGQLGVQQQHENALDSMRTEAGLQQTAADAAQARGRSDLEFGLTTRQNMELHQLADSEAKALADPSFTANEKEELRYRFAQRRAGLQPVARPKAQTPAELFSQNTHVDPHTGRVYSLDPSGQISKLYEPPERQATVQDRVAAWKEALAAAKGDGLTPVGQGELERRAKGYYQMMMTGTEPQAPPGQAGALSPDVLGSLGRVGSYLKDAGGQPLTPGDRLNLIGQTSPVFTPPATAPDVNTIEGVGQRLGEIGSVVVDRGVVDPEKIQNLATVDHQLAVARDLGKRYADQEAKDKAARATAPTPQSGLGDIQLPGLTKSAMEQEAQGRYARKLEPVTARVAALEKRRNALVAQHDELQGLMVASQLRAQAGQAAVPPTSAPSAPAVPALARRERAIVDLSTGPRGPGTGDVTLKTPRAPLAPVVVPAGGVTASLTLKDGRTVQGKVTEANGMLTIDHGGGVKITIPKSRVAKLEPSKLQ